MEKKSKNKEMVNPRTDPVSLKLRYFRPKDLFDTELILLGFERYDVNGFFSGFRKKTGENKYAAIFRLPKQSIVEDIYKISKVKSSLSSGDSYIYLEINPNDFPDDAYSIEGRFKIKDLINNWNKLKFIIPTNDSNSKDVSFILKGSNVTTKMFDYSKAESDNYYHTQEHSLLEFPKGFFLSPNGDESTFLNDNEILEQNGLIAIWSNILSSEGGLKFMILGVNEISDTLIKEILPSNQNRCSIYKQAKADTKRSDTLLNNLSKFSFGALGANGNIHFKPGKILTSPGTCNEGNKDVAEWQHNVSMARDQQVQITTKYRISPFGHEATVIDITERQNIEGESRLVKKRAFKITQETVDYNLEINASILRKTPFKSVQVLTTSPVFIACDEQYPVLKKEYVCNNIPTDFTNGLTKKIIKFANDIQQNLTNNPEVNDKCQDILNDLDNPFRPTCLINPNCLDQILFNLNIIKKEAISSSPTVKEFEQGYSMLYEYIIDFKKMVNEKRIDLILGKYYEGSKSVSLFKISLENLLNQLEKNIDSSPSSYISNIRNILKGKLFNDSTENIFIIVKTLLLNLDNLRDLIYRDSSKFLKKFNEFWFGTSDNPGFSVYEKELRAIAFDRIQQNVSFWPKKSEDISEDVILDFCGTDKSGNKIIFRTPVLLINNDSNHLIPNPDIIKNHIRFFSNESRRKAYAFGQPISYHQNKAIETKFLELNLEFLTYQNDIIYIPQLESALFRLGDLEKLFNYSDDSIVSYNKKYLDHEFGNENPEKILFDICSENNDYNSYIGRNGTPHSVNISPLKGVFSRGADKFSGISFPELRIKTISLRKEAYSMYENLIDIDENYNPKKYAQEILGDATLLGLKIFEFFIDDKIKIGNNLPQNLSEKEYYKFYWMCDKNVLINTEVDNSVTLFENSKLIIDISKSKADKDFKMMVSLSDFSLGIKGWVNAKVSKIETNYSFGTKPNSIVNIHNFEFYGVLKFLDELSHSFISDNKSIPYTVDFEKVTIQTKLGLPSLSFGAFNLTDLFLTFSFKLYYNAPPKFGFYVSDKQNPFFISLGIFAGKGYFGLEYSTKGIEMCEASFGFGAYVGMSLLNGGVTGSTSIMATISYTNKNGKVSASLVLECIGRFSVSGIALELSFTLAGPYCVETDSFISVGEVTLNVKLGFFNLDKRFSFEKRMKRSGLGLSTLEKNDGNFSELHLLSTIDKNDWDKYTKSFI